MSNPRIDGTNGVNPTYNPGQGTSVRLNDDDEPLFVFTEDDTQAIRTPDGEEQKIRVGTDEFGHKYRYLDKSQERVVTVSTSGKNKYMKQSDFDYYVRSVTGSETLPDGVSAEFENGVLIFKKDGEKITLNEVKSMVESEKQKAEASAQIENEKNNLMYQNFEQQILALLGLESMPEALGIENRDGEFVIIDKESNKILSLDELQNHESVIAIKNPPHTGPFSIDLANYNISDENITTRAELRGYMESHVGEFLPELVELYTHEDKNGKRVLDTAALTEVMRTNFDIRQPSRATAQDIDNRLAQQKSPMKGMGQAFIDAEKKYGINAWAIVGVIGIESSYGKIPAEGTEGNFCGMKVVDGNEHRELKGKTQQETYINNITTVAYQLALDSGPNRGRTTLDKESQKYCPPNHKPWSRFVAGEILQGQMRHLGVSRTELVECAKEPEDSPVVPQGTMPDVFAQVDNFR